jgi:hypothetical protein
MKQQAQSLHPILEKFLADLPVRQPLAYKAVYPKRILTPTGFMSPEYYALTLWSQILVGFDTELNMLPHLTGLVSGLMQLEYRVPTYFVRSEFAQAVAQTEPPADFKLSEIRWPLPAMLFVLPTDFVLKTFGHLCPFISVSKAEVGVYPRCLKHLPKCEVPLAAINELDNQVDRINIVYPVYSKSSTPVDYTGSYPLHLNVNEMASAPFQDATYMEEARLDSQYAIPDIHSDADLPQGEAEKVFNNKVQAFAVKLLLALTARPSLAVNNGLARPAKVKKGRVRPELWNPNVIGWDYRAVRPADTGGEHGTHASPRMHWRKGTWRNQPYGPRPWTEASLKKLIWIEPCLVNAPPEEQPAQT